VCTAIGYNLELIRHGETGFLCTTEEEWMTTLVQLIEDAVLRQQVAEAARREVELRFSVAGQARVLRDLFGKVIDRRRGAGGVGLEG
jgi:glycosyltransferase involved in cell wall biosynthesis